MPGDAALGALLRDLRTSRRLTLATVARHVDCVESLISLVETGKRQLQPWLAERLDGLYRMGGTLVALHSSAYSGGQTERSATPLDDVLLVRLPEGGVTVPLSRRGLLAAFGIGALSGSIFHTLDNALGEIRPTPETVRQLEQTLDGFQAAARIMPPARMIDPLAGRIAIIDVLRQRASPELGRDIHAVQGRYAECLSWMHEEAGDVHAALYWIDRASQWAQTINWGPLAAYSFVRRSMLALSHSDDRLRAIENARAAINLPGGSSRVKGLAAKQLAFALALMRRSDESSRALDLAMDHFAAADTAEDDTRGLGQRSVANDDLYTIFRSTCDVYLGRGESVIPILRPRLAALARASLRTHAITSAKLVHAYATAGAPDEACTLLSETLDAADSISSSSAKRELHRAAQVMIRWDRRSDVQEVLRRLESTP